jgi:Flp pilus assembly protein TadD
MFRCASIQAHKDSGYLGQLVTLALLVLTIPFTAEANPQKTSAAGTAKPAVTLSAPLREARELIQKGLFDQAAKILEDQVKQDPTSVDAYNLLGIAYAGENDYVRALDAFQRALTLAPNSVTTHNNLGNLYVSQQKSDLAEREFKKVLSIAQTNRDANYNLGLLLLAKGAPAAAIEHFERVHPLNVETRFNLVRAYLQAGKTTQALQAAHELSAAHKQDVQLHFTLGVLLASAKQYKSALLELEQANELQP